MSSTLALSVYFGLVGLIVGSYLNVVIHRIPLGLSTVLPHSSCPSCRTKIRVRDNIPVFSYLFLRGRCRTCQSPISWRYPLVEATTGVLFALCFQRFARGWEVSVGLGALEAGAAAVFGCLLIALAMIDLEHFLLPDRLTLSGVVLGLALAPWVTLGRQPGDGRTGLLSAALGAALGAGVLLVMIGLWYLIRGEPGMGWGDVKMLAMIGAFLGVPGVVVSLFVASLSGALVGLALIAFGGLEMKSKLPFGFFLSLGGLTALFAGQALVAYYVRYL